MKGSTNKTFVTGKTVDGSNNLTVLAAGFPTLSLHVTSTSSLAGVFEGTMDDISDPNVTADWFPIPAIYQNTSGVTENAPGATITPTDDDTLHACLTGCRNARFRRTAGSGTVNYCLNPDSIDEIRSAAGDVSTTVVTPPAIQVSTYLNDGTDEILVSATARKFWGWSGSSIDDVPAWIKFYDKATAASESDTPFLRDAIPCNSTAANGAGRHAGPWPVYVALTNGLSFRAVAGIGNSDDTGLTTTTHIINVYWSV